MKFLSSLLLLIVLSSCASVPYIEPSLDTATAQINFESDDKNIKFLQVFLLSEEQGCEQNSEWVNPNVPLVADLPKKNSARISAEKDFRVLVYSYFDTAFISYSCSTIFQFMPNESSEYNLTSVFHPFKGICGVKVNETSGVREVAVKPDEYIQCK